MCQNHGVSLEKMVSDTEVVFLTMSYVCPNCSLFLIEDSIPWERKENEEKGKG